MVLVLRRGRVVRAGRVLGLSGVGRRRSFLREGPNGVVLRMEVGTLDPLALSMLPSPSRLCFLCGLGVWECENSMLEFRRDLSWGRDDVAAGEAAMTSSRHL
ncbi:hypothetical protein Taro_054632, partial [Colocasia esculenta]|nr:hypothetical protein [Colocasia esculenta]